MVRGTTVSVPNERVDSLSSFDKSLEQQHTVFYPICNFSSLQVNEIFYLHSFAKEAESHSQHKQQRHNYITDLWQEVGFTPTYLSFPLKKMSRILLASFICTRKRRFLHLLTWLTQVFFASPSENVYCCLGHLWPQICVTPSISG